MLRKIGVLAGVLLLVSGALIQLYAQPLPPPVPFPRETAVELLTNGGFETDENADQLPDGWTGSLVDVAHSDKLKCDAPPKVFAHSGSCAFAFKGNADKTVSSIKQVVLDTGAITDGSALSFSAYVDHRSAVPGTVFGKATVKFSDGTGTKLKLNMPAQAGYVQQSDSKTISIPSGATLSQIKVIFQFAAASGKYYLDDVSLQTGDPIPTPTPTDVPTAAPAKLVANDGSTYNAFGWSTALSGTTAIVGAPGAAVNGHMDQGAAYIFFFNGSAWVQQQKLTASDGGVGDQFGSSVAISGDTAVVGAWQAPVAGKNFQGAAYVFVRNGSTWTLQQKLTASDGALQDFFGTSVAISGSTLVVGAEGDDFGANQNQGSAYVFVRSGSTWTQQQKLSASNGAAADSFGHSVAISDTTVAVGARSGGNLDQGAVYVYVTDGSTWTLQQQITPAGGAFDDKFGYSVALSSKTLVVGARDDDHNGTDQGSAYVFVRSGGTWTQQQQLVASDGAASDQFGNSVAISGDTVVIGATSDSVADSENQGSAYIFTRSGTTWTQQQQLTADDGAAYDYFGQSVALDGKRVVVGAYYANINGNTAQGAAYVNTLQ